MEQLLWAPGIPLRRSDIWIWFTGNKRSIKVSDMTDDHLRNCIAYLERHGYQAKDPNDFWPDTVLDLFQDTPVPFLAPPDGSPDWDLVDHVMSRNDEKRVKRKEHFLFIMKAEEVKRFWALIWSAVL